MASKSKKSRAAQSPPGDAPRISGDSPRVKTPQAQRGGGRHKEMNLSPCDIVKKSAGATQPDPSGKGAHRSDDGKANLKNGGETDREDAHERDRKLRKRLEELRPIDDDFARVLLGDEAGRSLVERVIRLTTGFEDLEVVDHESQRDLRQLMGGRSVELDVWARDNKGRIHDLEVQTGGRSDPKRLRYHGSVMDAHALLAGTPFRRLPERWVIFVMEKDPKGRGKATYHYKTLEADDHDDMGDEVHYVYANCAYEGEGELGDLLRDFVRSDPAQMADPVLRDRVNYFKRDEEGVREMTTRMWKWREEDLEEGRKEGRESMLLESLRSLMDGMGCTADRAFDLLSVPEGDRARLASLL